MSHALIRISNEPCIIAGYELKPIKNDGEHRAAMAVLDDLWNASVEMPEGDLLDAIVDQIIAYERVRWPMTKPTPVQMIRYCMENQEVTAKDLEPVIGDAEAVAALLDDRSPLMPPMVEGLAQLFKTAPELFMTKKDCTEVHE